MKLNNVSHYNKIKFYLVPKTFNLFHISSKCRGVNKQIACAGSVKYYDKA